MDVCHCSRGVSARDWLLHIKNVKIKWTAQIQHVGLEVASSWYPVWTGATPCFQLWVNQSVLLSQMLFSVSHSLLLNKIIFLVCIKLLPQLLHLWKEKVTCTNIPNPAFCSQKVSIIFLSYRGREGTLIQSAFEQNKAPATVLMKFWRSTQLTLKI